MSGLPDNLIVYGPDANCTLALCPTSASVYEYQPNLGVNIAFLILFAVSMVLHIVQGVRYRSWFFMGAMVYGCVAEIIGYGGRILLWQNPFSFDGFLIQIICITIGPAFFSAGIYVTLSKLTQYLDPTVCRFPPKLYYWLFIPCDLISLALQSAGGAMSSSSDGSSQTGVDVALAGLSFQVITLTIFIALSLDYALRYRSSRRRTSSKKQVIPRRFTPFVVFLSLAILFILIRCAYRIAELKDGYSGDLIHNQGLFIGLEGVMVIIAVFCLNVAHPGPVFSGTSPISASRTLQQDDIESKATRSESDSA